MSTTEKFRTHQGADPLYEETSTAYGLQNTQQLINKRPRTSTRMGKGNIIAQCKIPTPA